LISKYDFHFKDDRSTIRATLVDLGIKLHESDLYWIKRTKGYWLQPEASRQSRKDQIRQSVCETQANFSQTEIMDQQARRTASINGYWQNVTTVENWEAYGKPAVERWLALDEESKRKHAELVTVFWASLTNQQYENRVKSIIDGCQAFIDSLTEEEYATFLKNHKDKVIQTWTPERRRLHSQIIIKAQIAAGCFGSPKHIVEIIDGKSITFHSRWEVSFYKKLKLLNAPAFTFANETTDNILQLNTGSWNVDYKIVNDLIDVKGHPEAYKKFYKRDLPGFLKSSYSKQYNLYLCEYDVNPYSFKDYNELLSTCTLIHSVT